MMARTKKDDYLLIDGKVMPLQDSMTGRRGRR